jgi:hypothetical protein
VLTQLAAGHCHSGFRHHSLRALARFLLPCLLPTPASACRLLILSTPVTAQRFAAGKSGGCTSLQAEQVWREAGGCANHEGAHAATAGANLVDVASPSHA